MKNNSIGKLSKPIVALAALGIIGGAAGVGALASAQTATGTAPATTQANQGDHQRMPGMRGMGGPGRGHGMGAGGTVTAVSGNTITITGDNGTTYTVDASGAKVSKVIDLTVADIKVGDRIGAEGTLSDTTVTAKHIMDGIPAKPAGAPAANAAGN